MRLAFRTAVLAALTSLLISTSGTGQDTPGICNNVDMLRAVRIIDQACRDSFCDSTKLHEIEGIQKSDLLRALSDPSLSPRHIFFPSGKTALKDSFDWGTIKRSQLDSIADISNPNQAVVFIIGYASITGSAAKNVRLSRERMESVYDYLQNVRHVRCRKIKGAWVGNTTLQLDKSDATLFNLFPRDYRNDNLILNQAVHVFIYPCADKI